MIFRMSQEFILCVIFVIIVNVTHSKEVHELSLVVHYVDVRIISHSLLPAENWELLLTRDVAATSSLSEPSPYVNITFRKCFQLLKPTSYESDEEVYCRNSTFLENHNIDELSILTYSSKFMIRSWIEINGFMTIDHMSSILNGSESYFILDLTLPKGGLDVYNYPIVKHPLKISIPNYMDNNNNNKKEYIITSFPQPYNKIKLKPKKDMFHMKLNLQIMIVTYCQSYNLPIKICFQLFAMILNHIKKLLLINELGLPPIQIHVSPEKPFVFLHIPKTAGSYLRK